jgi:hypothetical protein
MNKFFVTPSSIFSDLTKLEDEVTVCDSAAADAFRVQAGRNV